MGIIAPEIIEPATAIGKIVDGGKAMSDVPMPIPMIPQSDVTILLLNPSHVLKSKPPAMIANPLADSMNPNSSAPLPKYLVTNNGISEPSEESKKFRNNAMKRIVTIPGQLRI